MQFKNLQIFALLSLTTLFTVGCSESPEEQAARRIEGVLSGDPAALKEMQKEMQKNLTQQKPAIETIDADKLFALLPESLEGRKRVDFEKKKHSSEFLQITIVEAEYKSSDKKAIKIQLMDQANASGPGKALMETMGDGSHDMKNEDYFNKSTRVRSYPAEESMIRMGQAPAYKLNVFVAKRFFIEASGMVESIDELRAAVEKIDFDRLASMKNEGKK